MLNRLLGFLQEDKTHWDSFKDFFQEKEIPSKTTLLREGEVSHNLFFIRKGCLRIWFNNDGKDITTQFFFENQAVSSFESFFGKQPSLFSIESIEPSSLVVLSRKGLDTIFKQYPEVKFGFQDILIARMSNYANLFLSQIRDTPKQRYMNLMKENPGLIQRIPQHYIASYLGITPISLSRIRNKI